MEWYYYVIIAIIAYPIVAILAGNFYWYMFNKYLTVTKKYKEAWAGNYYNIFCQKKPSLLFRLMFYSLFLLDQEFVVGEERKREAQDYVIEIILNENPKDGYDKTNYVLLHLLQLPFKVIRLVIALIIYIGMHVKKLLHFLAGVTYKAIGLLSSSGSQENRVEMRAIKINTGHTEEVVAQSNPKRFRAPDSEKEQSPAIRLKAIAVEQANLALEQQALEEKLQTEEDAQASEDGARVYHLKASNGD